MGDGPTEPRTPARAAPETPSGPGDAAALRAPGGDLGRRLARAVSGSADLLRAAAARAAGQRDRAAALQARARQLQGDGDDAEDPKARLRALNLAVGHSLPPPHLQPRAPTPDDAPPPAREAEAPIVPSSPAIAPRPPQAPPPNAAARLSAALAEADPATRRRRLRAAIEGRGGLAAALERAPRLAPLPAIELLDAALDLRPSSGRLRAERLLATVRGGETFRADALTAAALDDEAAARSLSLLMRSLAVSHRFDRPEPATELMRAARRRMLETLSDPVATPQELAETASAALSFGDLTAARQAAARLPVSGPDADLSRRAAAAIHAARAAAGPYASALDAAAAWFWRRALPAAEPVRAALAPNGPGAAAGDPANATDPVIIATPLDLLTDIEGPMAVARAGLLSATRATGDGALRLFPWDRRWIDLAARGRRLIAWRASGPLTAPPDRAGAASDGVLDLGPAGLSDLLAVAEPPRPAPTTGSEAGAAALIAVRRSAARELPGPPSLSDGGRTADLSGALIVAPPAWTSATERRADNQPETGPVDPSAEDRPSVDEWLQDAAGLGTSDPFAFAPDAAPISASDAGLDALEMLETAASWAIAAERPLALLAPTPETDLVDAPLLRQIADQVNAAPGAARARIVDRLDRSALETAFALVTRDAPLGFTARLFGTPVVTTGADTDWAPLTLRAPGRAALRQALDQLARPDRRPVPPLDETTLATWMAHTLGRRWVSLLAPQEIDAALSARLDALGWSAPALRARR